MRYQLGIFVVGLFVGYVSGLFGKGGSAIATPLLQLIGVPPFYAVVSPLPATIPGTLVASLAYLKSGHYDRRVVTLGILAGVPSTIAGAWLSNYVTGHSLLVASNIVLIGLGIAMLMPKRSRAAGDAPEPDPEAKPDIHPLKAALVAVAVGLISGLLANSGGFLLAPLYHKVLKLPLKSAFACSLLVSAALAVPGTVVHVALGHVDWSIVVAFGLGSVPLAYLGARTALRMPVKALEATFGLMLTVIGIWGAIEAVTRG